MAIANTAPATNHVQWLALALTPSLGPSRCRRLVEHFGGTTAVFTASLTEPESARLPAAAAQSIEPGKSAELAQEELVRAASVGAQILTLDDSTYPPLLKQIYDPPVTLYVRGDAAILSAPGMGVVGFFRFAIASSAGCRWACWWSRQANTAGHASPRAAHWSKTANCSRCRATLLTAVRGAPNALIMQGAKPTATWEGVWEELPADVRAKLEADRPSASEPGATASLFQSEAVLPHQRKVLALLKKGRVHAD